MRDGICKFCIVAPDRVVAKLSFIAGDVGVILLLCVCRWCSTLSECTFLLSEWFEHDYQLSSTLNSKLFKVDRKKFCLEPSFDTV